MVIKFEFFHEEKKLQIIEAGKQAKKPHLHSQTSRGGMLLCRMPSSTPLLRAGCQACGHLYFVCLHGWRLYHLCVQPVPVLDHTHREKLLLVSKWNCIVKIGLI